MNNNNLNGIINIYKEKNYTSHDVVNIVRKTLNKVKTGHTGTLDPQAEGVLPICIGKATKIADYIASDIKEYIAEIKFGITTSTQDSTGDIIEKKDVLCSNEEILNAVLSFKGEYMQTPPMYSALKVNGKKLYEIAREGKIIERKKRLINIYNIELLNFIQTDKALIKVLCSKGTYIRTLCNDIGEKLNCGAHMSSLIRTRAGNFYIKDSIKLDEFKKLVQNGETSQYLQPIDKVLHDYRKIIVNKNMNKLLYNGNKINLNDIFGNDIKLNDDENILVYDCENNIIGIYKVSDKYIKPLTMLI